MRKNLGHGRWNVSVGVFRAIMKPHLTANYSLANGRARRCQCVRALCGMQQAAFPISKARKPITGVYAVALSLYHFSYKQR